VGREAARIQKGPTTRLRDKVEVRGKKKCEGEKRTDWSMDGECSKEHDGREKLSRWVVAKIGRIDQCLYQRNETSKLRRKWGELRAITNLTKEGHTGKKGQVAGISARKTTLNPIKLGGKDQPNIRYDAVIPRSLGEENPKTICGGGASC